MWKGRAFCQRLKKETGKLTALSAEDHAQEGIRKVQSSAVNPSQSYFITAFVHQIPLTLLIDTGAAVSLLGKEQWMRLGGAKYTMEQWNGGTLVGVNGSPVNMEGVFSMDIVAGGQWLAVEFAVVSTLCVQSLLGIDFLKRYACVIDVPNMVMQCHGLKIPLETAGSRKQVDFVCQARATLMENVTVPAWSEVEVLASTNSLCGSGTWLLDIYHKRMNHHTSRDTYVIINIV